MHTFFIKEIIIIITGLLLHEQMISIINIIVYR